MSELLVAFITGLTTGGLSCLAVQGGLLASSVASQVESDLQTGSVNAKTRVAQPILWFLLAKLAAYTILGFFLGWLGSVLQLDPVSRAILQIAIGIFMVGQALRLFNVHPIFRYFNLEPPKFVTRYIRRKSKDGSPVVTPLFMGVLTILIPCGITQVMMASAMAIGNPLSGAALMFSFILGTSPIFFIVAYFTTRIGERMEKYFLKFVGVVVLILGLIGINSGLNLMGSPLSVNNLGNLLSGSSLVQAASPVSVFSPGAMQCSSPGNVDKVNYGTSCCTGGQNCSNCVMKQNRIGYAQNPIVDEFTTPQAQTVVVTPDTTSVQEIVINVQNTGYSPEVSHARSGVPSRLVLVSNDVYSCSLAFVIPSLNEQVLLEPTGIQTIELPAMTPGSKLPYSCSMGMYTGVIIFDQ